MSVSHFTNRARTAAKAEQGITMIVVLLSMLVTSLLLTAAYTGAIGDTHLSHMDLAQKQAYYAALTGIQEYEYKLEANPDYWEQCEGMPSKEVPGEKSESYEVTPLAASSDPEVEAEPKKCKTTNPFKTMIESKGSLINTFRIKSVGKDGTSKRTLIATFQVAGFLDYIYFTQYEDRDPQSHNGTKQEEEQCPHYRSVRNALGALSKCGTIYFGSGDNVNGPMHTDDTAVVCGGVEFGRASRLAAGEPDAVEMNGGAESGNCGTGSAKYNTTSGKPETKGPELIAPESDGSLKEYVESGYEFSGRTKLVLEGEKSPAKIKVTNYKGETKSLEWPKNGLIYVKSTAAGCPYEFNQEATDTNTTYKEEETCGSVYVKGTYSSSLTIAAEEDLIVNGNIYPASVKTLGEAPAGSSTTTLGLIATRFVRIYHPCTSGWGGGNTSGEAGSYLENPWIYGAILSTSHSFLVDNFSCGNGMGNLNVYGAIAQKFRGIVGQLEGSGYEKEYIYDERLATDEPPYFLAPLKAGWRIARLTAPSPG